MLTQAAVIKLILQYIGGSKLQGAKTVTTEGRPVAVQVSSLSAIASKLAQFGDSSASIRNAILENPKAVPYEKLSANLTTLEERVQATSISPALKTQITTAIATLQQSADDYKLHTDIISGQTVVDNFAGSFDDVIGLINDALASAEAAAAAALASENAAGVYRDESSSFATTATTASGQAQTAAVTAVNASTTAGNSATAAAASVTQAAGHATAAGSSASAAEASRVAAEVAGTNASNSASAAATSASAALASQSAAGSSASAAQTSATNAATSASNASTSATQASTSETNAAGSASSASTSATNAANSASAAGSSASAAATSASSASTSATAAGVSATASESSRLAAEVAEDNATSSASAASSSAASASSSASSASTSSSLSATYAGQSADALSRNFPELLTGSIAKEFVGSTSTIDVTNPSWVLPSGIQPPATNNAIWLKATIPYEAGQIWQITANMKKISGAASIALCYFRALDENFVITGPEFYHTPAITTLSTNGNEYQNRYSIGFGAGTTADYTINQADAKYLAVAVLINRQVGNLGVVESDSVTLVRGLFAKNITQTEIAETQANIATTQATNASASAASASTSSTLSATYAGQSASSRVLANSRIDFINGRNLITNAGNYGPSSPDATTQGLLVDLGVQALTLVSSYVNSKWIGKPIAGRTIRINANFRTAGAVGAGVRMYIAYVDASYNYINAVSLGAQYDSTALYSNYSWEYTFNSTEGNYAGYLIQIEFTQTGSGAYTLLRSVDWQDVTSEKAATTQAGIATTQAASATSSAATATTQASLSATYASQANTSKLAVDALEGNLEFNRGFDGWSRSVSGTLPGEIYPASGFIGSAWEGSAYLIFPPSVAADVFTTKAFDIDPNRTYRITANYGAYRTGSSGDNARFYIGFAGLDINGTPVDHGVYGSYRYCITQGVGTNNPAIVQDGYRYEASVIVTGTGNDSWNKFPPGTVKIKLLALMNYNGGDTTRNVLTYLGYLKIEDITESIVATTQATIATSQATLADGYRSAAQQSAILSANVSRAAINLNSGFDNYPTAGPGNLPATWVPYSTGTSNAMQRVADTNGGYSMQYASNANAYDSIFQRWLECAPLGQITPGGYYVVEADVVLDAGTLQGAGVWIDEWTAGEAAYLGANGPLSFVNDKDVTGVAPGSGVVGRRYRFSKLFKANDSTVQMRVYAMNNYVGGPFGTTSASKTITWNSVVLRPATQTEIRDQTVLAPMEATVAIHSSAIAEAVGRSQASWGVDTVAGAAGSFIRAQAFTQTATPINFSWLDTVNLTIDGNNNISRTTGGGAWDSGCYSSVGIVGDCTVGVTFPEDYPYFMVGLNSDPATDRSYISLDYAWYCNATGDVHVYESGNGYNMGISSASARGARFTVERSGTSIIYKMNGKVIRTVTGVSSSTPLYADTSLNSTGAVAKNVTFSKGVNVASSNVSIGAEEFHVLNSVDGTFKKALSVVGGNATFAGELNVGGTTGGRVNIQKNVIKIFDASSVLRVKLGDLSL